MDNTGEILHNSPETKLETEARENGWEDIEKDIEDSEESEP